MIWWRSGHRNLQIKPVGKCRSGAKIPVAIQALVKIVLPIQDLWSCISSDTGTLDTCRNCLQNTCLSQGVNMHVHGLDSCWECLFLGKTVSSSPRARKCNLATFSSTSFREEVDGPTGKTRGDTGGLMLTTFTPSKPSESAKCLTLQLSDCPGGNGNLRKCFHLWKRGTCALTTADSE